MTPNPDSLARRRFSDLEKAGALMGHLLHDLSNQLCTLAGHLQIMEGEVKIPEAMRSNWEQIQSASQSLGGMIEEYAGFQRRLRREASGCSFPELAAAIVADANEPGPDAAGPTRQWKVSVPKEYPGEFQLAPHWISFAVWEIVRLSAAREGEITLYAPDADFDRRGLKAPPTLPQRTGYAHLLVCWEAEPATFTETDLFKRPTARLGVVLGITNWVQGGASYAFLPPRQNRFWISLPIRKCD